MRIYLKSLFAVAIFITISFQTVQASSTEWVKSFGGNNDDQPYATAVDANGNLFVLTKYLETCDFDPNPNKTANETPTSLSRSVAVSKYDANGVFKWVKSFSANSVGGGAVYAQSMVLDKAGNIYFAGNFSGITDFNPDPVAVANLTPQPVNLTNPDYASGNEDGYVCKLDNNGNFVWVKQILGDINQEVLQLCVDDASNIYISSISSGSNGIQTDFDPDPTATNILTNTSNESQYITKLDVDGKFVWAKQIQGTDDRYSYGLKTDKSGNIYIGGHYIGTIYPNPTNKSTSMTAKSLHDIFFIKWDAAGNYIWSKSFGDTGYDVFGAMDIDQVSGSVYISGQFSGSVDFNAKSAPAKTLVADGGNWDGFFAKYDGSGNCLWAKRIGGTGSDNVGALSVDGLGNLFVGGMFQNTANFDAGASNLSLTSAGNYDGFIMKLDTLGSFKWVKQIGGLGNDWAVGVAATGDGNIFAAGGFTFDAAVSDNTTTLTAVNGYDAWMYKSSATTAINELKQDSKISIYPNPTSGKAVVNLNKEYQSVSVIIRSATGSEFSTRNYQDVSKIDLDFPAAKGLYFVELRGKNNVIQNFKVVRK